jgi:hypothetical protein
MDWRRELHYQHRCLRLAWGFLRGRFIHCNLQLTYRCNFQCQICDFWKEPHDPADEVVRLPERDAGEGEVLGEIGRGREAGGRRGLETIRAEGEGADHAGHDLERAAQRVRGVEERLLVLLEVAVVSERQPLEQGEQRHEVAGDAAGLAAHQLGHVGVLLLGHQARAGAVLVADLRPAERRVRPDDQLLGEAREVRHRQRGAEDELSGEVAVGHRVQAVGADRRLA